MLKSSRSILTSLLIRRERALARCCCYRTALLKMSVPKGPVWMQFGNGKASKSFMPTSLSEREVVGSHGDTFKTSPGYIL